MVATLDPFGALGHWPQDLRSGHGFTTNHPGRFSGGVPSGFCESHNFVDNGPRAVGTVCQNSKL